MSGTRERGGAGDPSPTELSSLRSCDSGAARERSASEAEAGDQSAGPAERAAGGGREPIPTLFFIRDTFGKVARVVALLGVLVLLGALFVAHHARAQMSEEMLGLGARMMRYGQAEEQDEPRSLYLNGQHIRFASAIARHPLSNVLDYYQSKCEAHDGKMGEQIRALVDKGVIDATPEGSPLDAVLRQREHDHGFVACFDLGTGRMGPRDLLSRLRRFQRSLDFSDLGGMRYVYGVEAPDGRSTHFVAFWTDGHLRLGAMFPAHGDAPGQDVRGVPRPPGARRVLTAFEDGHPQTMTTYAGADRDSHQLEQLYRRRMPRAGWSIVEDPKHPLTAKVPMLVFERSEQMVTLVFEEDDAGRGGMTVLTAR